MSKAKRTGKVFVDWSQNDRHKTTVYVYSLRAMERPTVSTPVTWDEARISPTPSAVSFASDEVLERVASWSDLFRAVDTRAGAAALMHRIVVVGGGGGCAPLGAGERCGGRDRPDRPHTNHFLFQPLLYQVATGVLSGGQIAPALRGIFRRDRNVRVLLGEVEGFDVDRRVVRVFGEHEFELPYDTLIVAAGANRLLLRPRRLGGARARDEVRSTTPTGCAA